jgi:sortase A
MAAKKNIEDYSEAEIRKLLLEKHMSARQDRLDHYYKTGRAIRLIPDIETSSLDDSNPGLDLEEEYESKTRKQPKRKEYFSKSLMLIEFSVMFVLMLIFFKGFDSLKQLNQDTANAFILPTLTPTPLIRAIALPSGHTPPTSPGGARPIDAEIPAHLQPLVQSYKNIPIPTPAHEHANRIQIPAIGIDAPIVQGTGWDQLKKGVGQVIGTANPGEKGNLVLSAHNDVFGELFRYLDQLQPGDQFTVFTYIRTYTYEITGWEVVEPTRVEVMDPTPNATATLISCYPYLIDNMRIVVKAELLES